MNKRENKETLLNWLKGAYMMEKSLVAVLDKQAEHAASHPELHARILKHKNETQRHVDLVKSCVTRHGGKVSDLRAEVSKLLSRAQSQMIGVFDEVVLKDAVMSSASEELEISTYKAIIKLAEHLGDEETVSICKEILKEEEDMLNFLNENLGNLVDATYFGEARPG